MPDGTDMNDSSASETTRTGGPVSVATDLLLATAQRLDEDAMKVTSLCDGWSRGHVLAHIARNADALTNLLVWASTGDESYMYPSAEARAADIDAGAHRPADEIVEDVRTSAARFSSAITQVPEDGWERQVRTGPGGSGATIPARRVVWLRLREVELHHVDLDAGYGPADWPAPFVSRALAESLRAVGRRDGVPAFTAVVGDTREPVGGGSDELIVRGGAAAMLGWLTGRTDGTGLTTEPPGSLPTIPPGAWL